jgi:hypothetical protein
LPSS